MTTAPHPLPGRDTPAGREAERRGQRLRRRLRQLRARMRRHPVLHVSYRILVAVIGGAIVVGGLILVPLPGPGWLVVFIGIAVLGTEFEWARRLGRWGRRQLDRALAWWRQRRARRAAGR
ncbi:TIGR02611 family protein [Gryllotalpicola ginsengisoli]|uniref:TIGR02611 family protein n=1 Tax=Gryllotalpicola ginsengisoli TaxID=444608 RepID=UPI000404DE44|nr:TIGR02611 family protein [Gryllotalpicola ginsengisoli]